MYFITVLHCAVLYSSYREEHILLLLIIHYYLPKHLQPHYCIVCTTLILISLYESIQLPWVIDFLCFLAVSKAKEAVGYQITSSTSSYVVTTDIATAWQPFLWSSLLKLTQVQFLYGVNVRSRHLWYCIVCDLDPRSHWFGLRRKFYYITLSYGVFNGTVQ